MRYYLDFDRTLFDTDAAASYLETHEDHTSLEPGILAPFLYTDAAAFLREKENAVTIIVSGEAKTKEYIVQNALHGIPRMSVMYTGDQSKGAYLAPHTHLHRDACAVDDSPGELEIYAALCPGLTLVELRRDSGQGDGRWPVIRSLSESF